MNLHEHQTKAIFQRFGIPAPMGKVATTSDQAYEIAKELGGVVVVKAQVLAGGRGKAGGVKVAKSPEEAREAAGKILGMKIKDLTVHNVLVDPGASITKEVYLGITNDRSSGKPVLICSYEGGVEIEEVAKTHPELVIKEPIHPIMGLHPYQVMNVASRANIPREYWQEFGDIALKLWQVFLQNDAVLAEINPLVITGENKLIALDGKMGLDDNALQRHTDLADLRDLTAEDESETQAREAGISYVKLNGQIGCMVNGAGLAMTTMDMTKLYGGDEVGPANFLDIGGGAKADRVAAALRIILSDPNVKAVLFNIFGGITRGDEVARGLLQAYEEVKPNVPLIIRLVGTNAKEGREIIETAQLPNVITASTLTEAAQKAVQAAKGAM
ncbi:MAG: ADP-forming succinate--CoA ligase subunit beta [Anaerolineae bacterium]|nr:ADP-forming succinate--CoA ligase subunit beta [Anaerolineae bacterium]